MTEPDAILDRHLADAAERLRREFDGTFAIESVQQFLTDSRDRFVDAPVTTFLPILIERFARERLKAYAQTQGTIMKTVPEILFVCVHNAGRSQMAGALLDHHAQGRVNVRSAGSAPANEINPAVVHVVDELGIDISKEFPKPLTNEVVEAADVVITMSCGDACPF
jgi:arsenate reductase